MKWSDFQIFFSLFLLLLYLGVLEWRENVASWVRGQSFLSVHSGPSPSRKAGLLSSISAFALLDCVWHCLLECNSLSWLIWPLPLDGRLLPFACSSSQLQAFLSPFAFLHFLYVMCENCCLLGACRLPQAISKEVCP